MPLAASLRKRLSTRNLQDAYNQDGPSPAQQQAGSGNDFLRPQSAAHERPASAAGTLRGDGYKVTSRPNTASERPSSSSKKRFSLLRNRHASDPQLFRRYQADAGISGASSPDACPAPVIGITSPTWGTTVEEPQPKRKFNPFLASSYRSSSYSAVPEKTEANGNSIGRRRSSFRSRKSLSGNESPGQLETLWSRSGLAPDAGSLASTRPSTDRSPVSPDTMSIPSASAGSKLFKIRRRKAPKKQEGLFPLPVHLSPQNPQPSTSSLQVSTIFPVQPSPVGSSHSMPAPEPESNEPSQPNQPVDIQEASASINGRNGVQSIVSVPPTRPPLGRHSSANSAPASQSPVATMATGSHTLRGRSGTTASFNSRRDEERAPTPWHDSVARTSMTSTTLGRNSIAGLRSFTSKLRNPSERSPRQGSPPGGSSKKNSFALSKETLVVPDREEGESATQYYARLEKQVPRKYIGSLFTKSSDPFSHDVLRSHLRTFKFFEEPMDISLRKFLWEVELPTESQQIDRMISAFSQRYFECNPPLFNNADDVYLLAFSLVMLHSDLFNKSNKHRMQRHEYQRNTRGANVDEEILGYFYDNIQYTEFINELDDDDESVEKTRRAKARKKVRKIKVAASEDGEKGKVDPYDFILDDRRKLDKLRPALKGVMNLDDSYHYLGTSSVLDISSVKKAFHCPHILQTISSRSRPDAFRDQATINNPDESARGVVEIKVAKAGIIWRKDPKKRAARSPWQEWGALLTQSQLHFFRNKEWVKDLVKQVDAYHKQLRDYDHQLKHAVDYEKRDKLRAAREVHAGKPVIFRPAIDNFRPDYSIKTLSATALHDSTYDKHKNAFLLVNVEDFSEEVLLADNEREMNDWLAKVNFASTFTSAKIDIKATETLSENSAIKINVTDGDESLNMPAGQALNGDSAKHENGHPVTVDISTAREKSVQNKIDVIGNGLKNAQQRLEEQLKTARHLQILAPFPPGTRGEMLSFGARMAHRVRWTRFDIWKLRAHRDMLSADLLNEPCTVDRESKGDMTSNLRSGSPRMLPSALTRLNSKASSILYPQKIGKPVFQTTRERGRPKLTSNATDFAGTMDQALSTPLEMTRSASSGDVSSYKLPPLMLSTTTDERPHSSGTDSVARHGSIISNASRTNAEVRSTTPPRERPQPTLQHLPSVTKRPSTAMEPEKEIQTGFGSPTTRAGNRRSLQRTLRESKEFPTHTRSRRGKDSISSSGVDDGSSIKDKEQLSRAQGSFKLHGKKASIITLGSDFSHFPAEERLKARNQALMLDNEREISEAVEEDDAQPLHGSSFGGQRSSSGGSQLNLLEAPLVGDDGASLKYVNTKRGEDADEDEDGDIKRFSSSTAVGGLGSDDDQQYHDASPLRQQDVVTSDDEEEEQESLASFKRRLPGASDTAVDRAGLRERSSVADDPPAE